MNAAWNRPAAHPNHVWSYDFMSGRTREGGPLRILNVVDEYTRVALACASTARSVPATCARSSKTSSPATASRRLALGQRARVHRRQPAGVVGRQGVQPAFIEKGSSQQNPYVERFNGTMREEAEREEFDSVLEARVVIAAWIEEYNAPPPPRPRHAHTTTVRRALERGTE